MDLISALLRTRRQGRRAIAIVDGREQLTWDEFVDRTGRLAGALRTLGVTAGRTAGVLAYGSARVFEFFYAVPWTGGMMCPLNFRLSANELAEILEDSAIDTLLVDDAFTEMARTLQGRVPRLRNLIHTGPGPTADGMIAYEALIAGSEPLRNSDCRQGDVACLYYSGGTTGKPKGVMLTHGNIFANFLNFAVATGVSDEDRFLHCGPLFHVASGSRIFNAGTIGACSIIMPRFDAGAVLQTIERHRITFIALVPTMLNTIVQLPQFDSHDLSSLRMIMYGASQISLPLLQTVIAKFDGIALCQAYGQTETAPFATVLAPRYHTLEGPFAGKLRSAGRPIGSVEVRVVDADDNDMPTGAVGEVIIRGPNVMKGYFNQPELTRTALRGGWMTDFYLLSTASKT
jgi:long-chain acyl-CoA synthetase